MSQLFPWAAALAWAMHSIKTRLVLALGITLLVALGMAVLLYFGARGLDENAERTRDANDEVRELLSFALVAHGYMDAFEQSLGQRTLLANNERRRAAQAFEGRIRAIPQRDQVDAGVTLPWRTLHEISSSLSSELARADALRSDGKFEEAARVFDRAKREHFDRRMLPWFEEAIELQRKQVDALEATALSQGRVLRQAANVLAAASAALVLLAAFIVLTSVLRPVRLLVHGANAIAAGDLDHRIAHKGKDELSLLATRFNAMAASVQKSNQVLVEKNAALEEAYRLQSEFLSIVSHELRSPLNSIIGYSELVLEDGDALSPTSSKNVQSIGAGAQRLLSLINDILDFSKLRAGRMEARSDRFRIAEVTELVVAEARALARGRDIEIALHHETEPGEMLSDETKVRQILTNLLSNAVKFTQKGSVKLSVERNAGDVTFRVRDTGIGVPENQLSIIFEPFRQAQGSDRRAVGGTGLGLAIVARLSKLLGGTVSAQSAVGEGTEFTVRLPCYLE